MSLGKGLEIELSGCTEIFFELNWKEEGFSLETQEIRND